MLPSIAGEQQTCAFRWRKASISAKVYLITALFHGISLFVISLLSFGWSDIEDLVGILGLFVAVCLCLFIIQGILTENNVQILCGIASASLVTLYLVTYLSGSGTSNEQLYILIFTILSGCFTAFYVILYIPVTRQFGWYRYEKLKTTNKNLMNLYYQYQIFKAMVLLDTEVVTFLVILIINIINYQIIGYLGNALFLVIQIGYSYAFILSVKHENSKISVICQMFTVLLIVYIGYYLYYVITNDEYKDDVSQVIIISVLAGIVRFGLLVSSIICMQNFNKGLRAVVTDGTIHGMDSFRDNAHLEGIMTTENKTAFIAEESNRSNTSSRIKLNSEDFD